MVGHTCYKCNKTFDKKSNYDYHMNKKFPCSPITVTRMDDIEKTCLIQTDKIKTIEEEIKSLKLELKEISTLLQNNSKLDKIYTLLEKQVIH